MGHGDPGRHFRHLRAGVPPRHRGRDRGVLQTVAIGSQALFYRDIGTAARFAARLAATGLICATLQACARVPAPIGAGTAPPVAQFGQQQAVAPTHLVESRAGPLGRTQVGKASYYAPRFNGRTMADGRRYEPKGTAAASKTLPLGTTVKVTNLDTDKSAIVQVEDRGPYVRGRIIDVSATVAETLDMKDAGVAHVAVKPVAVPHPNGTVTLGSGAAELPPGAVARAIMMTERLAPTFH